MAASCRIRLLTERRYGNLDPLRHIGVPVREEFGVQLAVPRGGDGTTSVDGRGPRLSGVAGWIRRRRPTFQEPHPHAVPPEPSPVPEAALEKDAFERDATVLPVAESLERTRVRVRGTVGRIEVRTRSGWPRLEVELDDGSASVVLIWLGRRRIGGVEAGGTLVADGMLVRRGGRRVIFNPSYELEA